MSHSLDEEAAMLPRIGARQSLSAYFAETWQRRPFLFELARARVSAQMSENRLGLGWVVIQPILLAAIFGTIFGIILPSEYRPANFIPFLIVGMFLYQFYARSFTATAKSVIGNKGLVHSLAFPRVLLPLAVVVEQVLLFIPALAVMLVIVVSFGEPITWKWLVVIPVVLLMAIFNAGLGLVFARIAVHMRDITQLIPLINRVAFYSSGIFYSLEAVLADRPEMLEIARLNPIASFIQLLRAQLITGADPSPVAWAVCGTAAVVLAGAGVVFFWRGEELYGRE